MNARTILSVTATISLALLVFFGTVIAAGNTPNSPAHFGLCGESHWKIHEVQGDGASSPLEGDYVILEAVVVGDFQEADELEGFFLQEEDDEADANPETSEGIYIDDDGFGVDVEEGDVVRLYGTVEESFGRTQMTDLTDVEVCSTGSTVTPASITLPVAGLDVWEYIEGMALDLTQTLFVTDNYNQGRYGEVSLSVDGRLFNPTNVVTPGAAANALQDANDLKRILLDDGSSEENPEPPPYFMADGTLRAGDSLDGLAGVLDYGFSTYRVHPTEDVEFMRVNERPEVPDEVGGALTVASFNVLNYFTTIDEGQDDCGPSADLECRGADSPEEFVRQRTKIIAALQAMDADIVGLMEIENNETAAVEDLVAGLNDAMGAGTYSYIDTGTIGTDAIKVALIYKPGTVTPAGDYQVLDSAADPTFNDDKNRPVLAQTFEEIASGETVTVAVNHLKSKGSDCEDVGDPDTGDGQGNCNLTRTSAAVAQANWLAADPTGSGDPDVLVIGDLNAYAMEDPIAALTSRGYLDLVAAYLDSEDAYSYTFFGQAGYLDQGLASGPLVLQVTGATIWHINSDEPNALDYNDYNQDTLYQPDPFRSSDHDPVIVGLALGQEATTPEDVRFATFNASLNRNSEGELREDLTTPDDEQAQVIAEIIQHTRPHVLLVNEFDYDASGQAAKLFQDNYLSIPQGTAEAIVYPYRFVAPSNTGIDSGFDLNKDGELGGPDDAFGFGFFPGQYGMAVYSMYPIDTEAARTFQLFLWNDMPGAMLPKNPDDSSYYTPDELDVFRLSSKSHWDLPVLLGDRTVHFLTSHPTPPVFDGPEDRNGTRNYDEIRFWADYIDPAESTYIYDDEGATGGLPADAYFVIAGDQNADPFDGDSIVGAANQLTENVLINNTETPASLGGVQQSELQDLVNDLHDGNPAYDTADFFDGTPEDFETAPGNLRSDYVLPGAAVPITASGVFWPLESDPLFDLVGVSPFPGSDHRLVWVDLWGTPAPNLLTYLPVSMAP
jgi:predicted extracellular nuclease